MRLERNAMLDNKLRTLLTLLSVGSYTKTADALHLTQPAVSHQIKQLEQEYGIQIFRKGKKGLNPTPGKGRSSSSMPGACRPWTRAFARSWRIPDAICGG